MNVVRSTEIAGSKFDFPDWYMEEHGDKDPKSFWMVPFNFSDQFEKEERQLIESNLDGSECVLELGGFVGVTSCFINKMLFEPEQHVVIELLERYGEVLEHNRDLNKCKFHVVTGQVVDSSERIHRDWYKLPKTTTIDDIEEEAKLKFDTLLMDCEGAEFDIIDQYPDFIQGLSKLMIEWHKLSDGSDRYEVRDKYLDLLHDWGFERVEREANVDFLVK